MGGASRTFVRGTIVVRNLTDRAYVLDTGLQGAKVDSSWDGRYLAFHAPKAMVVVLSASSVMSDNSPAGMSALIVRPVRVSNHNTDIVRSSVAFPPNPS